MALLVKISFKFMMLLVVSLALVGFIAALSDHHWQMFKSRYRKTYKNQQEESMRKAIFVRNKENIDRFNSEQSEEAGYLMSLNHLSDRTKSELKRLNGFRLPENNEQLMQNSLQAEQFLNSILNDRSIEVPDEVDWRKVPGRVTPVKFQDRCGSCWAFASTGVLEGQELIRKLNTNLLNVSLIRLSEQNLIDCSTGNMGCFGGGIKEALEFVKQEGGIDDENSYPYEAKNGHCRFNKSNVVYTDSGAAILRSGDEQQLKEVVAKFGPVAVAIDASDIKFSLYDSGVYYGTECKNTHFQLNHAVLIVGYGTDPKNGDYWIVKNSWSDHWGDKGYIRMSRNKNNNCGIATLATIPTFQ